MVPAAAPRARRGCRRLCLTALPPGRAGSEVRLPESGRRVGERCHAVGAGALLSTGAHPFPPAEVAEPTKCGSRRDGMRDRWCRYCRHWPDIRSPAYVVHVPSRWSLLSAVAAGRAGDVAAQAVGVQAHQRRPVSGGFADGPQLCEVVERIADRGGVLLYLRQEGSRSGAPSPPAGSTLDFPYAVWY